MKYIKGQFYISAILCTFLLCINGFSVQAQEEAFEVASVTPANAAYGDEGLSAAERLSLARNFVQRMKTGFGRAGKFMNPKTPHKKVANILPEGELLLLDPVFSDGLRVSGVMTGRVQGGKILISLADFTSVLELPIGIDVEAQTASGWYIRENFPFVLNKAENYVETNIGRFELPDNVAFEERDIFVPLESLGEWLAFEFDPIIEAQTLKIKPPQPLPIQEREARRKRDLKVRKIPKPILPLGSEDYRVAGLPFVDVSTDSRYNKSGNGGNSDLRNRANIRTTGDFLKGTLTTQSLLDDEDGLRSIRTNYKRESLDNNLLGPLKARRFEVGDVSQTNLRLSRSAGQELGARITNADPLRSFTSPQTTISGNTIPGWDVELYRESQLVSFQTVGDDGFYNFINVDLFQNDNNFRLVFYGPQGEVREEDLFIPVDNTRLAEQGGVYDISVTANGENTYDKDLGATSDPDEGSVNISALYERPLGGGTVGSIGITSNQQDKERNNVAHGALSTTIASALVNLDAAIDDEADTAAELTVRRDIGKNELSNRLSWRSEGFDEINGQANTVGTYENTFNARGPLPFGFGTKPRYNFNSQYTGTTEGQDSFQATAGASTVWKGFNFNNAYTYTTSDAAPDDRITSASSVTGRYGASRLRLIAEHELKPDTQLKRIVADYNHRFSKELELDLDLSRAIDPSLTEVAAQLNWQASFARISPSIRYNSNDDLFAGLSTRFGLGYDPLAGKVRATNQPITSNGGISAMVFLDQNGDGVMGEGEEPLEGVVVHALQNGGRKTTDENGVAFYTNLHELRLTDVFVDGSSLDDPQWVTGFEGISVLPREGYVAEVTFPVHIAGELDGTLYAQSGEDEKYALRNARVNLYNADGEIEQTSVTDIGGFYLFTQVPPGRYLLLVDKRDAQTGNFERPKPQQIEIGYDGTIIYGNDIIAKGSSKDIPSTILADLNDYKALHPHINFSEANYDLVMNLGDYNSKIMASIVWYRLQKRYSSILGSGQLMVPAKASVPDAKSGKHTLRVGLPNVSLEDAYNRCRALTVRNLKCEVEIFPAFMEHEFANNDGVIAQ